MLLSFGGFRSLAEWSFYQWLFRATGVQVQGAGAQTEPLFVPAATIAASNYKVVLFNIIIAAEEIPDSFVVADVQRKMQTALNNAKLSIFVSLTAVSAGPGEVSNNIKGNPQVPLGIIKYGMSSTVPYEYRHAVVFSSGSGQFLAQKRPIAATPGDIIPGGRGTQTTISITNADAFRMANSINNDDENATFYANVLLHEVFWRGYVGRPDQNRGPYKTRLSTGESPEQGLLSFEKSDIDILLNTRI